MCGGSYGKNISSSIQLDDRFINKYLSSVRWGVGTDSLFPIHMVTVFSVFHHLRSEERDLGDVRNINDHPWLDATHNYKQTAFSDGGSPFSNKATPNGITLGRCLF